MPDERDRQSAKDGLAVCRQWLRSGEWDVVILDELTIATSMELLSEDEVLDLLSERNPATEVIITGRYAPQQLIDAADLVTDMQEVKHYYTQGVLSRPGIDR